MKIHIHLKANNNHRTDVYVDDELAYSISMHPSIYRQQLIRLFEMLNINDKIEVTESLRV